MQGQQWVLVCSTHSSAQPYTAGWELWLCPSWTAQCSACQRWAGSKPWDTARTCWGVPTRHPLLGYCNRKNRQKTPEKTTKTPQPNIQTPKTKTLNKHKFHYPCSGHAASKPFPKLLNLSGVQQKQNNSATQYNSHCLTSPESQIQLQTLPPAAPGPSTASYLEHREQMEPHWGIYTQALKSLHSRH